LATIFKFLTIIIILSFQNFNKNVEEHSICNFSIIFWGGREIAQKGGKILPKVSPKLQAKFRENLEFKMSSKPQH